MPDEPECLFVARTGESAFLAPVAHVTAATVAEVRPALARVAEGVAGGLYAAGFLAYEAAPAFDAAFVTHPPSALPLLWFGLYREMLRHAAPPPAPGPAVRCAWTPLVGEDEYRRNVERIREWIAAGETYQVNYTFPLEGRFEGDTGAWFRQLCAAQQADHCAFLRAGRWHVLCASPELFFRLENGALTARPMKGTRPRGLWPEADRRAAAELAACPKERAENAMIVDLLRNDLGRVSEFGSVQVARRFEIERYPTVWQMTSTVASRTRGSVPDVLTALFPCGSVTGAPKVHTLELIRRLEPHPRGVYCGTVGWWAPDGRAEFNVAIRTVSVDTETGAARYHVGSGITYASDPGAEYAECVAKAAVLEQVMPNFELLESILFDGSYFLWEEHLARLAESAEYFGIPLDRAAVEAALAEQARALPAAPQKVRLLMRQDGTFHIEAAPARRPIPVRVGLARQPVSSTNVFLYHKTTCRAAYDEARASRPDCEDVLLWNERGELTESCTANLVLDLPEGRLTPPVSSGLLGGTFRRRLLADGVIREAVLRKEDLARARAVQLVNSVRRWIPVELV